MPAPGDNFTGPNNVHTVTLTPAISAAAIYAAGDAIGGLLTFTDALRWAGGTGYIDTVVLIDNDQEQAPIDLVLFGATFTPTADNAPFDPTDSDLLNCIGYLPILAADYANFLDNAVATVRNIGFWYEGSQTTPTLNLFGQMVVRDAPTYTAVNDLILKVTFVQD